MHFAVTLCVVTVVFVEIFEGAKICKVPNGEAGTCEEISKCKPLWDLYKKKHKTKEEHQYIGQAYCGNPSSSKIKMCCPDSSTWNTFAINPVIYDFLEPYDNIPQKPAFIQPIKQTPAPIPNVIPPVVPLTTNLDDRLLNSNKPIKQSPLLDGSQNCGVYASSANKITGGEPTAIDQYPWLVLLEYAGGSLGCGGSLITSRFVLTAAHCMDGVNGRPIIARLSEYNITSFPTDEVEVDGGGVEVINVTLVPVEDVFKHPNFTRTTYHNDIGLVKLAQNVVFTDFIKIVCLPTRDFVPDFTVRTNFTVAGWGDDPQNTEFFDVKKEVSVPYVPMNECRRAHNGANFIDNQICAGGEEGKDTCKGDSGGPLMYDYNQSYIIVGVVSFGPRTCGTKGRPAVYTHVFKYLNWIYSIINRRV